MSRNTDTEREREIGCRERAFNLQKQICTEIARGLSHLKRQFELGDPAQKFRIEKQISTAEGQLNDASERFESAAAELRTAYSLRGGSIPAIDTRIDVETNTSVVEEESGIVHQILMETALRKAEEDKIPYSEKLAVTTAFALGQVFKKAPEREPVSPATLSEQVTDCERLINRTRSEVDFLIEQVRPWRLMRTSSRLGELRTELSPELKFLEEHIRTKSIELAQLLSQHQTFMAEARSQSQAATAAG
jgi:hypothetical protein